LERVVSYGKSEANPKRRFSLCSCRFAPPPLTFIVSSPCCPRNISCRKVLTASQTIGDTSTPKAGGMVDLVGRRSHSVGNTIIEKGKEVKSVWGRNDERGGKDLLVIVGRLL